MSNRQGFCAVSSVLVAALVVAGCASSEAVTSGPVAATVVHVAPDGADSASGSMNDPLRTPQAGVDRLPTTGGVVALADGVFRKQRIVLDGRTDVTIRPERGAAPVLDATGLAPPKGESALVEIRGGSGLAVEGVELTGYRTRSMAAVPAGILVTGGAVDVRIADNHVHHLGNDNPTSQSSDTNAHGIAVYGRSATRAIKDLTITGNEVDHLVLGASEAVVVNGNVDGWSITDNHVHHNNNIGIDAIGYEDAIAGPDRYTDVNRARNGAITGNTVTDIATKGNPAYEEDDGGTCTCADGIYVDGGRSITIADNTVERSDIGIEVAAEDPQGRTNDILVQGNTVRMSRYVGLAIGGYGPQRGQAYDVRVRENTFLDNNTLDDGSPEILLQYKVHDTRVTANEISSSKLDRPLLVKRVKEAGSAAQNANVVLDDNTYRITSKASRPAFAWRGKTVTGLPAWRTLSGQDRSSTVKRFTAAWLAGQVVFPSHCRCGDRAVRPRSS